MGQMMAGFCALLAAVMVVGCNGGSSEEAKPLPTVTTKSGVGMVVIPAGSFQMGNDRGREEERPAHTVWVDSFLMDRYPVRQSEFEKLGADADPPFANASHFKGPDLPAEMVAWREAVRFCNARSLAEGLKPCYSDAGDCDFDADGYRLPTEAEWEYACRAGTTADYSFGGDARQLGDYAWFADNSGKKTHAVGQKRPNPWGLHDMHGNVLQWCNDRYDRDYYKSSSPEKGPRGPDKGKLYVLRGGSWKSSADECNSSHRLGGAGGFSDACLARDDIGFRCVRKAPDSK
jgi:formylglycine-generating enzyme required for sulfatase activity